MYSYTVKSIRLQIPVFLHTFYKTQGWIWHWVNCRFGNDLGGTYSIAYHILTFTFHSWCRSFIFLSSTEDGVDRTLEIGDEEVAYPTLRYIDMMRVMRVMCLQIDVVYIDAEIF